MSEGYHRKKKPVAVRSELLRVAARLSVEKGLQALTLDAVARAAGVSKGGLMHHFPTKQALLEALHDELLTRFEAQFDTLLEQDPDPHGRFARAYLHANLSEPARDGVECWNCLVVLMLAENWARARWSAWVSERLAALPPEEQTIELEIVRLAADGIWFADMTCAGLPERSGREKVLETLEAMTHGHLACLAGKRASETP